MININLLPEVMRKKERTPLPQLIGYIFMAALIALVGLAIFYYMTNVVPTLERERDQLTKQRNALREEVKELGTLKTEIDRLSDYVETVKSLYRNRIVWAKILSDIKNIINFNPQMSVYNADMQYIWLVNLDGKGNTINLKGYATSSNQLLAMQMPEQLIAYFLSYAPTSLPEKDEEEKLEAGLRAAMAEHDKLRAENPELPIQGQRELAIRQRLEEIKTIKSGGIAMQPFVNFLVPGSLRLHETTWTNAPRPREKTVEVFPAQAWSFTLSMTLR